jgi:hypothetical protein
MSNKFTRQAFAKTLLSIKQIDREWAYFMRCEKESSKQYIDDAGRDHQVSLEGHYVALRKRLKPNRWQSWF